MYSCLWGHTPPWIFTNNKYILRIKLFDVNKIVILKVEFLVLYILLSLIFVEIISGKSQTINKILIQNLGLKNCLNYDRVKTNKHKPDCSMKRWNWLTTVYLFLCLSELVLYHTVIIQCCSLLLSSYSLTTALVILQLYVVHKLTNSKHYQKSLMQKWKI